MWRLFLCYPFPSKFIYIFDLIPILLWMISSLSFLAHISPLNIHRPVNLAMSSTPPSQHISTWTTVFFFSSLSVTQCAPSWWVSLLCTCLHKIRQRPRSNLWHAAFSLPLPIQTWHFFLLITSLIPFNYVTTATISGWLPFSDTWVLPSLPSGFSLSLLLPSPNPCFTQKPEWFLK